jgi:hypothetical protein
MADKWYTAASGNWSVAGNWNGSALPQPGDDVYADGKAVVIDQNVNVGSIRTTQRTGGTIGGSFTVNTGGYTIACTSALGITTSISAVAINITATSGTTTINSNLTGSNAYSVPIVSLTGASNLNINGDILTGAGNNARGLSISAAGAIVTIVGNCQGGTGGGSNFGIQITANSVLNITGNVIGGSGATSPTISNTLSICTINIIGSVTGNVSNAINSNQNSTINITGNLTSNNVNAVFLTAAPTVTVVGTITASNSAVGLFQTGGTVTFRGTAINSSGGAMAIYCPTIKLYNGYSNTVEWRFRDELGNVKTLYSAGLPLGNPLPINVRSGSPPYGASGELTGTMIVPSPSDVRISVPTDNTVGTGQLTAADFLAAIAASSDPIAVRLNNVSTVDTSGAQMASYNV